MNPKAQQMTETIAVLFIFFILIVFGIIFYAKYQTLALEQKAEETLGKRAIDTSLKALFLPEIACTKSEYDVGNDCVDELKMKAAAIEEGSGFFQDNEYYFDLFSYATITITYVYPTKGEEEKTVTLYDRQPPEEKKLNKEPTYSVISIKDTTSQDPTNYGFGYITVWVYS